MYLMYTLDAEGKRVYTLKVRERRERERERESVRRLGPAAAACFVAQPRCAAGLVAACPHLRPRAVGGDTVCLRRESLGLDLDRQGMRVR